MHPSLFHTNLQVRVEGDVSVVSKSSEKEIKKLWSQEHHSSLKLGGGGREKALWT